MRRIHLTFALLALALPAGPASADLTVDLGHHELLPNQADQLITLSIAGTTGVGGLDFEIQVADGTAGPVLTDVDLVTDTIFADDNLAGQSGSIDALGRTASFGIFTFLDEVAADGLLATLSFDTTGIPIGTYDLSITDIPDPSGPPVSTRFFDFTANEIPATLSDGTITVIPEPGTLALLSLATTILLVRRNRPRH